MKYIKYITLTITFFLLFTACGGSNSSDSNRTESSLVETSSLNQEPTTPVEVSSNEVIPSSSSVDIEDTISELPTVGSRQEEVLPVQTNSINDEFTANAGEDKTTSVNQSLSLIGRVESSSTEVFTYEWTKGISMLATTASFDYTPQAEDALPTAGHRVDVLTFTVRTENGDSASDMVNITVLP